MALMDDSKRTLLGFNALSLDNTQKNAIISAANTMYNEIESLPTTNIELMVIDGLWANVWGTDKMSLDGIHPLAAGHTIMADNYFNAIKTILGEFGLVK
jgi:lysophospholipase L1-like esterase